MKIKPLEKKYHPNAEFRDVGLLREDFRHSVKLLIEKMKALGIAILPYSTLRGPMAQSMLWCRSRTKNEVEIRRKVIQDCGAPKTASLLLPQFAERGPKLTNLLPGQSWHQWGLAANFYQLVHGKAVWSGSSYKFLGQASRAIDLTSGYLTNLCSAPNHVQFYKADSTLLDPEFLDNWEDLDTHLWSLYDYDLVRPLVEAYQAA